MTSIDNNTNKVEPKKIAPSFIKPRVAQLDENRLIAKVGRLTGYSETSH